MMRQFAWWPLCLGFCLLSIAGAQTPEGDDSGGPVRGSVVEDRAARKLVEAGDARLDAEEAAKAVEVWQSVIERFPRSRVRFDAHIRLGKLLLERERAYDRARTHFEAVASEQNSDEEQRAEATLKMGICFYEARNFGKSFKVMRDVIEKFPVSPHVNDAYYYIGLGHFQLGHYSRAIEALEKVGTALSAEEGKIEKVEAGKRLFLKIEDADLAALEPGQTVKVKCVSSQGDEEIVECYPIGRNVRIVLGSIVTSLGRPYLNNGRLEVKGDDSVRIEYLDQHTSDRQFDQAVKKDIQVVGNAVIEVTDGAFQEVLQGVVLDRGINIQIHDADRDTSDAADKIAAVIEVYREKTPEEIQTDAVNEAAAAAGAATSPVATTTDPADLVAAKPTAEEAAAEEAKRFKLIDRIQVELTEVIPQKSSVSVSNSTADSTGPQAETASNDSATQPEAPAEVAPKAKTAPAAPLPKATPKTAPATAKSAAQPASAKPVATKTSPTTASPTVAAAEKTASTGGKPRFTEPLAPPDDGTIHTGLFRVVVPLSAGAVQADDDTLQAQPGDIVHVSYQDERHSGELPRQVVTKVKAVEGNLGGVRVTRAQISDQELRIKTQLKTADALTNIATRYKEFGLESNATLKYEQALLVCEEISDEASRLGGRLLEETYVQLWKIYYEMGRLELAAAMSQRLQREFPNSEFVDDALLKLAEVSRKQGDVQRAIGIYSRLVDMQQSLLRGEAQYGIAECYEELALKSEGAGAVQLNDRAFQEYKKVFEQFPESGRVGEAVAKMAEYYYKQKDYARAVDVFETVLNNHPDARYLDVILFNYGRCLYRMDRKGDARRQFDQLISDYPESPLAADAKKIGEALSKAGI